MQIFIYVPCNFKGGVYINFNINLKHRAKKIKQDKLLAFIYNFKLFVKSGVDINTSIKKLSEHEKDQELRKALNNISNMILEGKSIYISFREAGIFPNDFLCFIKMAQDSGKLDEVLEMAYINMEDNIKTSKEIKNQCAYPILVGIMSYAVLVVTMLIIVPKFSMLYEEGDKVNTFMSVCLFISDNFILVNISALAVVFGVYSLARKLLNKYENVKYRIPIMGVITLKRQQLSLYQNLYILLKSGVNIILAIDEIIVQCKSNLIRNQLQAVVVDINSGKGLKESLNKRYLFNEFTRLIVDTGIDSGHLTETLQTISNLENMEYKRNVKRAINKLTPILLCVLGVIIALIVLSVMLPMFSVLDNIG